VWNVAYLILIIIGVAGQNIAKKPYTQKVGDRGVYFFSTVLSAVALLFFVVTSPKLHFDVSVLPYSVGFAVAYTVASVGTFFAIAYGSLSLSSLFISYSLMIPTLYGLAIGESVGAGFWPGLGLLAVSLFLTNKPNEKAPVSFKWLVWVILAFVGNGMCSVVQKMQQVASGGAYKNEFMIVALAIVSVVMLIMTLCKERKDVKQCARHGWYLAVVCGVLNGGVNLFVMILSGRMPVSLMFSLISAGGLLVTYIVSKFLYKETLTKTQFVGFLFGLLAVVFLNI